MLYQTYFLILSYNKIAYRVEYIDSLIEKLGEINKYTDEFLTPIVEAQAKEKKEVNNGNKRQKVDE